MAQLRRLEAYLKRPVAWGAVILSYAGILAVLLFAFHSGQGANRDLKHEAMVREAQLCQVVINVNNNAKFRARTEHENLQSTLDYLADASASERASELYKRVRSNLPITQARVTTADDNVRATAIPPICQKYVLRSPTQERPK